MKLFSYSKENNEFGIGVETKNGVFNLTHALDVYQKAKGTKTPFSFAFLQVFIEMGYCSGTTIESILQEPWVQSKREEIRLGSGLRYELPIARPTKIIGIGRNYRAHAKELQHEIPDEPLFFSKAPSSIIPHKSDIIIPGWLNSRVDHEAELALAYQLAGHVVVHQLARRRAVNPQLLLQVPDFQARTPIHQEEAQTPTVPDLGLAAR